jgi:hypothetical protein
MLKFGKLVDLDELEAKSDRTKEIEAESALTEDAEKFRSSSLTIIKSIKQLEEQLTHVSVIVMRMIMMMMIFIVILSGCDSGRSNVDDDLDLFIYRILFIHVL